MEEEKKGQIEERPPFLGIFDSSGYFRDYYPFYCCVRFMARTTTLAPRHSRDSFDCAFRNKSTKRIIKEKNYPELSKKKAREFVLINSLFFILVAMKGADERSC